MESLETVIAMLEFQDCLLPAAATNRRAMANARQEHRIRMPTKANGKTEYVILKP